MLQKVKSLLFKNTSTRQTVAKNAFWLAISNVGGRLIKAVVIIYAARVLGTGEWGVFSYAISIVTLLTVFTDLGISPILVRETAKLREKPDERLRLLSTSFILKSVFLTVAVFAALFIVPSFGIEESVKMILPIAMVVLIFDTFRELGFSVVRALEKMEWEAALYLATNAAIVVFGFIFLYISPTVESFTYAYAVGTGIGMVATLYVLRNYLAGILGGFSWSMAKHILSSGWPFAISMVLALLMVDTDILIIGWLRGTEDVGLYSAAQRIVQLLYILPSILATSLLPTFSRLAGKDDTKLRHGLETVMGMVYLAAIPLALGGVMVGKEFVGLIFGAEYAGATTVFQILLLVIVINFPAVILGSVIFSYNKQKQLISYAAIGGISNIVLDLIFIPKYGIVGSAVATFVAQMLANLYLWRVAKEIVSFSVFTRLKKIISAAIIMGVIVFALQALSLHVIAVIAIGVIAYAAILFFMREPLINEIKTIRAQTIEKP